MNTLSNDTQQSINILAFDTSGDVASLALWAGGKMRGVSIPFGTGSHSQAACLFPMMQDLLDQANIGFQDLQVIATPKGPGSFTGIRLGLAAAQGLVSSTCAKSFAPTTFQIVAFGAWREKIGSYLVTISTKRDSFYTQGFDEKLVPLSPASIQTTPNIQEFLAQNPNISRIDPGTTTPGMTLSGAPLGAETLILLYLHEREASHPIAGDLPLNLAIEASDLLRPYYLHDPEFVKQKTCSL